MLVSRQLVAKIVTDPVRAGPAMHDDALMRAAIAPELHCETAVKSIPGLCTNSVRFRCDHALHRGDQRRVFPGGTAIGGIRGTPGRRATLCRRDPVC